MKTNKKNKLDFTKNSIVELNDAKMNDVNGGTSLLCWSIVTLVLSPISAVTTLDPN